MTFRCLFIFLLLPCILFSQKSAIVTIIPEICLSDVEQQLAKQINTYRAEKGLPPVVLSASLSYVGRVHAEDLENYYDHSESCNLHSWSDNGKWSSCCYAPNPDKYPCMWNKPRELTAYPGDGFEIAYWTTQLFDSAEEFAREILAGWKGSKGHNEVILNRGIWKDQTWKAMGIGISGGFACVWFGREEDPSGKPAVCR